MGRLLVERKGFVRNDGVRVGPARFLIKDRGMPGRGPEILPPLREGGLGGPGFFSLSKEQQRRIAFRVARQHGERTAVGRLRSLQVFMKRTNPEFSDRAESLARRVSGSFVGKKQVKMGGGFS